MELEIEFKGYILRLADDDLFTRNSTDNKYKYDFEYFDESHPEGNYYSKCGIRVLAKDQCLKSAILLSAGFSRLHTNSFVLSNDVIVIAVGKSVYSLSLPSLSLNWRTQGDDSSCFAIYEFQDGYIVHGELEITYINSDGTVAWRFSGKDIFASLQGDNVLEIVNDKVMVSDWNGDRYLLDSNGKLIK